MQLKYEVTNDSILLYMLVGPGETYSPEDNKDVVELHKRVKALEKKISDMRAEIDPELVAIKAQVDTFNKNKQKEKAEETE